MDTHALEVYLTLCRLLHFGRTSETCHMSPSTLSRLIQKLERDVGHALLVRDNRTVTLTEQGKQFRDFAQETLRRWERLQQDMGQAESDLNGKLSIFASVTASQTILPRVLTRFRELYPNIHIQLDTGYAVNAMQSLQQGSDVAVAALTKTEDERFTKKIIESTPIVPVSAAGATGDIDWQTVPLILPSHGQVRTNIDQWYKSKGLGQNLYSEVEGNEAALSLVALGCGIGFVPKLVLDSSFLKDQVQELSHGPKPDEFHVGFCVRSRALKTSKIIKAFWAAIN